MMEEEEEMGEEYIDLCHYETHERITVLAKKTGKEGQYIAHCINPDHEDKYSSMGINKIEGVYNCLSRQDAKGVTWDRHLREKGKGYKPKSSKKYLQEAEDKEIKSDILMGIDTDRLNWEGYDDTIKEEVRIRLPFDLCSLPKDGIELVMSSIVEAGIFRITDLRDRFKKTKNLIRNQLKSVKGKEKKPKEPEFRTLIPGLINFVKDGDETYYLTNNPESGQLSIAETWTDEDKKVYKPDGGIPICYVSKQVMDMPLELDWEELLEDIIKYLKGHIEFVEEVHYLIFALWIVHTYLLERTDTTPHLFFNGHKDTGKSRSGDLIHALAYNCVKETLPTAPVIYRDAELHGHCMVVDEAEMWLKGMDNDVLRILLSKYKRGTQVSRCNMDKGAKRKLEYFKVFGALVMCSTESLPEKLEDRCFKIIMHKNRRDNKIVQQPFNLKIEQELRDKLTIFRAYWLNREWPKDHKEVEEGRKAELLNPIYNILWLMDKSRDDEFQRFVGMVGHEEAEEQRASVHAKMARILIEFYNDGGGHVLTKDIREKFNEDIEERWWRSPISIGKLVKTFGFEKRQKGTLQGWILDRKNILRAKEKFYLDDLEIISETDWNEKSDEPAEIPF